MPQTNVGETQNVYAGSPRGINVYGGIYYLPLGEELPTDALAELPTSAELLGFVSEDGITIATDRSGDPTIAWGGDKVAYLQSNYDVNWQFQLLEILRAEANAVAYGDANVAVTPATADHGNQMTIKQNSSLLDLGSFVIDSYYGKVKIREVAPLGRVTEMGDTVFTHTELAKLDLTLSLFPDDQGNVAYRYTDDGKKVTTP